MPEPVERPPRRDDTAADAGTLAALGRIDSEPTPAEPPEPAPVPQPGQNPVDEQEAASLAAALTDAGVGTGASDQAAVHAIATLDAATVETVKKWLKTKKDKPQTPSK
jgi:hypothetical protein